MRGHSDATTHQEYIDRLPEPRQSEVRALHELILQVAPTLDQAELERLLREAAAQAPRPVS